MIQVSLSRTDQNGTKYQKTVWLDREDLKAGQSVKPKDEPYFWNIDAVYKGSQSKEHIELNRNWDNNNYDKHEGLNIGS